MSDIVDDAQVVSDMLLSQSIRAARQPVPVGVAGECEQCGDDSPRLVGGRCAPCRDGRNPRRG